MATEQAFKRFQFPNTYPASGFYTNPVLCICRILGNNFCILSKMLEMLVERLDCHYTVCAISTEMGILYPKRVFNLNWLRRPKSIRKWSSLLLLPSSRSEVQTE